MDFNPYAPPSDAADRGVPSTSGAFELASVTQRLLAKLIDALLVVALASPGIVMVEAFGIRDAAILIFLLPGILLFVQWGLIAASGQTLGKRWVGIRVVTNSGEPIGFLRGVVVREWVMKIGSSILYGLPLVIDPFFGLGPTRRCLHDHLADSQVVVAAKGR